jgi:hypothetical protein
MSGEASLHLIKQLGTGLQQLLNTGSVWEGKPSEDPPRRHVACNALDGIFFESPRNPCDRQVDYSRFHEARYIMCLKKLVGFVRVKEHWHTLRGVALATHPPNLAPRSGQGRATRMHLLPFPAFMACYRENFTFPFCNRLNQKRVNFETSVLEENYEHFIRTAFTDEVTSDISGTANRHICKIWDYDKCHVTKDVYDSAKLHM